MITEEILEQLHDYVRHHALCPSAIKNTDRSRTAIYAALATATHVVTKWCHIADENVTSPLTRAVGELAIDYLQVSVGGEAPWWVPCSINGESLTMYRSYPTGNPIADALMLPYIREGMLSRIEVIK